MASEVLTMHARRLPLLLCAAIVGLATLSSAPVHSQGLDPAAEPAPPTLPPPPGLPPAGPGAPDVGCPLFEVPHAGLGCIRPGGYEIFTPDGRSLGLVHGGDDPPATVVGGPSGPSTTGTRPLACRATTDTYYTVIIYARAFDDADDYAAKAVFIRQLSENADWTVDQAAVATGSHADIRVECALGQPVVHNAVLPTPLSSSSFWNIASDLQAQGYSNPRIHYWILYDEGMGGGWCGGLGNFQEDDTAQLDNWNNGGVGTTYAMYFLCPSNPLSFSQLAWLHEWSHNDGAVQMTAPHSTGAAHCWDGYDIMCYADGGPLGSLYTTTFCAPEPYDCNDDDYFHRAPPGGSYLDTHWNLGHCRNRYMVFPAGPVGVPPTPTGFSATLFGPTWARLLWDGDSGCPPLYDLRYALNGGPWQALATLTQGIHRYDHKPLYSCAQYDYEVRARTSAGSSAWSAPQTVYTPPGPPNAPQNLRVVVDQVTVDPNTYAQATIPVHLDWDASPPGGCPIADYAVYRSTEPDAASTGFLIATTPPPQTEYLDLLPPPLAPPTPQPFYNPNLQAPVTPCARYYYEVVARTALGVESDPSNEVHFQYIVDVCPYVCDLPEGGNSSSANEAPILYNRTKPHIFTFGQGLVCVPVPPCNDTFDAQAVQKDDVQKSLCDDGMVRGCSSDKGWIEQGAGGHWRYHPGTDRQGIYLNGTSHCLQKSECDGWDVVLYPIVWSLTGITVTPPGGSVLPGSNDHCAYNGYLHAPWAQYYYRRIFGPWYTPGPGFITQDTWEQLLGHYNETDGENYSSPCGHDVCDTGASWCNDDGTACPPVCTPAYYGTPPPPGYVNEACCDPNDPYSIVSAELNPNSPPCDPDWCDPNDPVYVVLKTLDPGNLLDIGSRSCNPTYCDPDDPMTAVTGNPCTSPYDHGGLV